MCLEHLGIVLMHHAVVRDEHLARLRIDDIMHREAAMDAGAEGLDDLALFHDLGQVDAMRRAAVGDADDDLLRDVDQTARQVAGVGGTQRSVGQALTGASGGDEVFQSGKAFTEVCLNRNLDRAAVRICHQAAHTGELTDLVHAAAGAGVGHHIDRVEAVKVLLQSAGDVLDRLLPLVDNEAIALVVRKETALVLAVDLDCLLLGLFDECVLLLGMAISAMETVMAPFVEYL